MSDDLIFEELESGSIDLFSDETRRNPFPFYELMRDASPVYHVPEPFDMWMIFDYNTVKRVISDHAAFSSRVPAPDNWFVFSDPPTHTKLRGLISSAFTPKSIAGLEPRVREICRDLLSKIREKNMVDIASEFAVPFPMKIIAEIIGIPSSDWSLFKNWSDTILKITYTMRGMENDPEAVHALANFRDVTVHMRDYLARMIREREKSPRDDLLTRLIQAEVDGEKLNESEILGFFQLLIVGGQETTTNLITNAILCLLENPEQLAKLRQDADLLPGAIEEVLRHCSPIQWVMRTPVADVELQGKNIPAGKLILAVIGSANRDPSQFPDPDRFDITRNPNPHLAFGHGIHSCIGAALSRMEARVALGDILTTLPNLELASALPWTPRKALHVHGPTCLTVRLENS